MLTAALGRDCTLSAGMPLLGHPKSDVRFVKNTSADQCLPSRRNGHDVSIDDERSIKDKGWRMPSAIVTGLVLDYDRSIETEVICTISIPSGSLVHHTSLWLSMQLNGLQRTCRNRSKISSNASSWWETRRLRIPAASSWRRYSRRMVRSWSISAS